MANLGTAFLLRARRRKAIRQHECTTLDFVTPGGFRHNVQIRRLYKHGDDWKDYDSFGRDDPPLVATVADRAHTWTFERAQDNV